MTEQVLQILERDVVASTDKTSFSTPREITDHVNNALQSAYSAKYIAGSMQLIGWAVSGAPMKRLRKTCRYYTKLEGDISVWALLSPTDEGIGMGSAPPQDVNHANTTDDEESLSSIDRRFRGARADKERSLANTRAVETKTAGHRETHLKLQYEIERHEYISVSEVRRGWAEAVNLLKSNLYTLPTKYSSRFASMSNDTEINDELKSALDKICQRLADAENDVVSPNADEIYKTQDRTTDVDSGTA